MFDFTKLYFPPKLLAILLLALGIWSCTEDTPTEFRQQIAQSAQPAPIIRYAESEPIPNQYIVVFKEGALKSPSLKSRLTVDYEEIQFDPSIGRSQVLKQETYVSKILEAEKEMTEILVSNKVQAAAFEKAFVGVVNGMAAKLNSQELESLRRDDRVLYIEEDQLIALNVDALIKTPIIPSSIGEKEQLKPYGIDKVGGSVDFSKNPLKPFRWAWVMDTGIEMDHPDLNVEKTYSKNFTQDPTLDDEFGHGTHVAGVIAAKNNSVGVTGVAAGATVVSIKVLDKKGKGTHSDIIAGLSYISQYMLPGDVINLSLGGSKSKPLSSIVQSIAQKGTRIVIAAGNQKKDVINFSPADANGVNVYTIGASDENDEFAADFSNKGSGVDFLAPGVGILSTYINKSYGYMTGTSMAAPHASGVLLVAPYTHTSSKKCKVDSDYIGIITH